MQPTAEGVHISCIRHVQFHLCIWLLSKYDNWHNTTQGGNSYINQKLHTPSISPKNSYKLGQKQCVATDIGTLVVEIAEKTWTSTYKQSYVLKDFNYTHYKLRTWNSNFGHSHIHVTVNFTATGKVSCISEPSQYKNDAVRTPFMHIDKLNTMWTVCAVSSTLCKTAYITCIKYFLCGCTNLYKYCS